MSVGPGHRQRCLMVAALVLGACGATDQGPGSAGSGGGGALAGAGASASGASAGSSAAGSSAAGMPALGGAAGAGGTDPGVAFLQGSVALLRNGSCAIDSKSALRCWGNEKPFQVPSGTFASVVADISLACGLRESGSIACFPAPEGTVDLSYITDGVYAGIDVGSGFCGFGTDGKILDCRGGPLMPTPAAEALSQVAMGNGFACGIVRADGSLRCWGQEPGPGGCSPPPVGALEPPSGAFTRIASSQFHSCAIRVDGTLACWGAGTLATDPAGYVCPGTHYGQSLPPSGTFVAIAVGEITSCGIRTDGTLACWGAGTTQGDCPASLAACGQAIPPAGQFAAVAVGVVHSCALRADRSVACWGFNGVGGRTTPPSDFP